MANLNQFKGTFGVFIPVNNVVSSNGTIIKSPNDEFAMNYIIPYDICKDPLIFEGRGIESDPHITIHMSLPESVHIEGQDIDSITLMKEIAAEFKSFTIKVGGFGSFQNKNQIFEDGEYHSWDVLWRKIFSENNALFDLHDLIAKKFNQKWHRKEGYNPHFTIGYLNYGTAEKYRIILENDETWTIKVDEILFKEFKVKEGISFKLQSN